MYRNTVFFLDFSIVRYYLFLPHFRWTSYALFSVWSINSVSCGYVKGNYTFHLSLLSSIILQYNYP
jgi:hypothetical protein